MDVRDIQLLREEILAETKKYINSKLSGGSDVLSSDSELALKQLGNSLSVLRESWSRTSIVASTLTSDIENIKSNMDRMKVDIMDTSTAIKLDNLNSAFLKLEADINMEPIRASISTLEKNMADILNRLAAAESAVATLKMANPGPVINGASIQDSIKELQTQVVTMIDMASKLRPFDPADLEKRLDALEAKSTGLG